MWYKQRCNMAKPTKPTLAFTTVQKLKNLIVINYECPPDPNHINHILESLIHITRLYAQTDVTKAQSAQNYISQITPQLFSLYDQSVHQMLTYTGATFCSPKDTYVPYANGAFEKNF